MCQRMASDTDLWLSAMSKHKSSMDSSGHQNVRKTDELFVINDGIEMPPPASNAISSKKSPTPSHKRTLNQEEFDNRLKAKRALFSGKGRSLSLASFSLPSSVRKVPKFLPLVKTRSSSPKMGKNKTSDEKYLEENRAQGELEILGLESLIDINDVKHKKK